MLDLLKNLCTYPGVSGDEGAIADFICKEARPHADAHIDALGNVIVEKKGRRNIGKKILLAAHMDEIGFIITNITDEGYLKFACVGGIDRRVILGQRVLIGKHALPGLIGRRPAHLAKYDKTKSIPPIDALYIDIGATDRESAEKMVALGDTACFDAPPFEMGDLLAARALDDRVGCAVMLELIKENLPCDVCFVFTVQEEIGCRGAVPAAFSTKPDMAFILECTVATNLPGVPEHKRACAMGGGVVIPFMDRATVYDRTLWAEVTQLASRLDIPWQTKRAIAGGTDASSIQRSRHGVPVLALAVAAQNIHSAYCISSMRDIAHLLQLTRAVLEDSVG